MNFHSITRTALAWMLVAAAPIVANAQSQHETHAHQHTMPDQASSPARGANGGSMKQAGGLQFETVVSQGGIKMFVFDRSGQPLSVEQGRGAASLRVEGNAKRYRYDLLPDGKGALNGHCRSECDGHRCEFAGAWRHRSYASSTSAGAC